MTENIVNENSNCENPVSNQTNSKFFTLSKRDTTFSVLFAISSILFIALGLFGGFRVGYAVSAILSLVIGTTYLWNKQTKIKF